MACSYKSYKEYLGTNGGKCNLMLLTQVEFERWKSAPKIDTWDSLNDELGRCNEAHDKAKRAGQPATIEMATLNMKRAYKALIYYEQLNCPNG